MPYRASWVIFDQLYRQFSSGVLSEGEYLAERWHCDVRYGELLEARGLLSGDELRARQQHLRDEMEPASTALRVEHGLTFR